MKFNNFLFVCVVLLVMIPVANAQIGVELENYCVYEVDDSEEDSGDSASGSDKDCPKRINARYGHCFSLRQVDPLKPNPVGLDYDPLSYRCQYVGQWKYECYYNEEVTVNTMDKLSEDVTGAHALRRPTPISEFWNMLKGLFN